MPEYGYEEVEERDRIEYSFMSPEDKAKLERLAKEVEQATRKEKEVVDDDLRGVTVFTHEGGRYNYPKADDWEVGMDFLNIVGSGNVYHASFPHGQWTRVIREGSEA